MPEAVELGTFRDQKNGLPSGANNSLRRIEFPLAGVPVPVNIHRLHVDDLTATKFKREIGKMTAFEAAEVSRNTEFFALVTRLDLSSGV